MELAISNSLNSLTATSDVNGDLDINNLLSFTFDDKYISDGTNAIFSFTGVAGDNYTYVGIAGHNLGSTEASIQITNHGTVEFNIIPDDDRPLMFIVPARTGGANDLEVVITKNNVSDKIIINHVATGSTTDFTSVSENSQVIARDYQANYPRIPMFLNRKLRTTMNQQGAPTATLIKTVSPVVKLNIDNVATSFAAIQLLTYQKFWVENGFFIQNDGDIDQSYMAFNFIPGQVKTHAATRELVNVSYTFTAYNGQ